MVINLYISKGWEGGIDGDHLTHDAKVREPRIDEKSPIENLQSFLG